MGAVLSSVDRAVRALAPVDTVVSFGARKLLPKRTASACTGILCGDFCEVHYDWGTCSVSTGKHNYVVRWFAQDSFVPCPHDCGFVVDCCY
jgi:hypothetical protein